MLRHSSLEVFSGVQQSDLGGAQWDALAGALDDEGGGTEDTGVVLVDQSVATGEEDAVIRIEDTALNQINNDISYCRLQNSRTLKLQRIIIYNVCFILLFGKNFGEFSIMK